MSELDREIREALERARADDLGTPRTHFRREPEPLPDRPDWGPLSFLQPATPWHLVVIGALLFLGGRMAGRSSVAELVVQVGLVLLAIGILSLLFLPQDAQPKRWRGRLINLDNSWRARLYRRIYRR